MNHLETSSTAPDPLQGASTTMPSSFLEPSVHHQKPSLMAQSSQPIFHPTVSKSSGRFISSASVTILVLFVLLLRSSAGPFLNPKGAAKKNKSSFFFNVTCFLYIWIISVTMVTLIPAFSTHYNGVIAASLFFPMTFSSIAVLLIGRFFIRLQFYMLIRCGVLKYDGVGISVNNRMDDKNINSTLQKGRSSLRMIAFHRPFRKLARNAIILSAILCLLYMHCWSRTLSLFKVSSRHGAGAVCRAVFTKFVKEEEVGANESSIWYLWAGAMFIMIISFAQDEWNGLHYQNFVESDRNSEGWQQSLHDSDDEDDDFEISPETSKGGFTGGINSLSKFLSNKRQDVPKDTLEMVPWLSLFAASCVVDIFLQLIVFGGRVDNRSIQSALQRNSTGRTWRNNVNEKKDKNEKTDKEKFRGLQEQYQGCIFDYSSKVKHNADDGFWFDFMADCGDGFNPSYQVARMLAQPTLTLDQDGKQKQLPRGQFLVNGGDLAYPNPTEYSYEKRFFRTFEDAMQPPPSFRRSKIATKKPGFPMGWKGCFHEDKGQDADIHELYKGPSSFIIPGNHDWYDGLATFSRLVLCRDWLGGWLLPQQRSYFALKLQEGWWILGMDCALSADIDIEQYKFFADVAHRLIGPDDAVIIVNHEPHWVTDFDCCKHDDERSEKNISELMQSHLSGKVRLRLAGDLHHYTRHVPVRKASAPIRLISRSRSLSFDETKSSSEVKAKLHQRKLQPFVEENRPELIVSGGGGAFLHGTHQFSHNIRFGDNRLHYQRVCAYPSEKASYLIGYMNLWHFRSRNYRVDGVMALVYFGLVSSLFPLCGLYADYEAFNPDHELDLLVVWSLQKIGILMWRVVNSENVSLLWSCVVLAGAVSIQSTDKKLHPVLSFIFGLLHGIAHISVALLCLLFVQTVVEWVVQDDIVKISVTNEHYNATNLASSLYENYKTHFFPVLENFTHPDSSTLARYYAKSQLENGSESVLRRVLETLLKSWKWIYTTLPLLKTTLSIFDLPGLIARYHHDICTNLCADGLECLLTHDKHRFLTLERTAYLKYMLAISLYFLCIAIPFAGGIFGTWLTISSNVFKSQSDLSFSALMVEHWKNFLKIHIKENGDLEVYAVGLQKVPKQWIKDCKWDGHRSKREKDDSKPTWSWDRPSKWVPLRDSKAFQPQIVDYTCIKKRQIDTSWSQGIK